MAERAEDFIYLDLDLDLAVLDFYLVPREDNWDIFADATDIVMPVGDVFGGDTGVDVEHNDGTVALCVVFITQFSEFFLPSNFPDVEFDESFGGGRRGNVLRIRWWPRILS